jgi:hypothetical protein
MTLDIEMNSESDFEPVGVHIDQYGRVLEVATCEYCQKTWPIHSTVRRLGQSIVLSEDLANP